VRAGHLHKLALSLGVLFGSVGFAGTAPAQMFDKIRAAPPAAEPAVTSGYVLGIHGTVTPAGLVVERVLTGTVADRFGLMPGDVIVQVNGLVISQPEAWATAVHEAGGKVLLLVRQGGAGALMQLEAELPPAVVPVNPRVVRC
jgi:S1-C subfamily serine protease